MSLGDLLFTICCWILGFMATAVNGWMVRHARALQDKYPWAFSSRIADRKWYPAFLRIMGLWLLLFAALWTARLLLLIQAQRVVR
jgi:hypothetical protein